MKRDNIQVLLDGREVAGLSLKHAKLLRGHSSLQEGLRVTHVLRDHTGCVNCLEWHPSGEELLSSGDDLKVSRLVCAAHCLAGFHFSLFVAASFRVLAALLGGPQRHTSCVRQPGLLRAACLPPVFCLTFFPSSSLWLAD